MNDRANGLMTWFRVVLPILTTIMIFMLHDVRGEQREIKISMDKLSNNLHHEMIEVKQRLTKVETLLENRILRRE